MAEPISCEITPWYTKRMSLMTLMFVGFGLYFLYDGFIGYPKKNAIFREHETFQQIQEEKKAFLEGGKTAADWKAVVEEKGYPTQDEWIDYAADNGWPEEPPEKIKSTTDQFVCGLLRNLQPQGLTKYHLLWYRSGIVVRINVVRSGRAPQPSRPSHLRRFHSTAH